MSNNKTLSVIVPIYCVEPYIKKCIESITNQTYKNLEIILVDDGSTGREPEICDEYALKDNRIKVIHKKNAGLVEARKTGLESITGEYVIFVDGDDFIANDLYERMMCHVNENNVDLLAISYTEYKDGVFIEKTQGIQSGIYENDSLTWLKHNMNCKNECYYEFGIWPSTWSKIYKTSLLKQTYKNIPSNIRLGEDCAFSFPYILNCKKIVVDNSITGYFYRILTNSMSKTIDENLFNEIDLLYHYLKPFYEATKDYLIIKQLELERAYLINVVLNYWMVGTKFEDINKKNISLKKIINRTLLFEQPEKLLSLPLPYGLNERIKLISENDWENYEKVWKKKFDIYK